MRLVCGVGYNDGKYKTSVCRKHTVEYDHWKNMIDRCYSPNMLNRNKTYINVYVSENFKSFSYFHDWCHKQTGFNNNGWNLDKDLLIKRNNIYSEDLCVFLPKEINQILVKSNASRGDLPIGVSFDKRRGLFESCIRMNGRKSFLGYFNSEIKAHLEYKKAKEAYIKEVAQKWESHIDKRAFQALINYRVDIDD